MSTRAIAILTPPSDSLYSQAHKRLTTILALPPSKTNFINIGYSLTEGDSLSMEKKAIAVKAFT